MILTAYIWAKIITAPHSSLHRCTYRGRYFSSQNLGKRDNFFSRNASMCFIYKWKSITYNTVAYS